MHSLTEKYLQSLTFTSDQLSVLHTIAEFLKNSNEKEIRDNMKFAPAWMRVIVFEIMGLKQ